MYAKLISSKLEYYSVGQVKNCLWVRELSKFVLISSDVDAAHQILLGIGYLPVIHPTYNKLTHVLGEFKIVGASWQKELIDLTQEEKAEALISYRIELEADIKSTCRFYLDQLTREYSATKYIRFQEDKKQMDAGNTQYFDRRAGSRLTGSQYLEAFIRPKIVAGVYHADTVIGIETTLLVDLMNTPDSELINFDLKSAWDEASDFIDPPVEVVDPSWQEALKSKLRIKLW